MSLGREMVSAERIGPLRPLANSRCLTARQGKAGRAEQARVAAGSCALCAWDQHGHRSGVEVGSTAAGAISPCYCCFWCSAGHRTSGYASVFVCGVGQGSLAGGDGCHYGCSAGTARHQASSRLLVSQALSSVGCPEKGLVMESTGVCICG